MSGIPQDPSSSTSVDAAAGVLPKRRSAGIWFIFATIFLDALGIGVILPILPDVIRRFTQDAVVVAQYFGYFMSIYAFMQLMASPILGSLADRFGRRPVLLVSLFGAGIDYLVMAFSPSLLILFIGRVISGLTGASMTVASAYLADISTDENRAANFGMIGAAFGLGFIFGPALGGLLGAMGPTAPFIAAALFNLANFAFGAFLLPESLPADKRRMLTLESFNPLATFKKVVTDPRVRILLLVYFLVMLGGQSHASVWTLYSEYKFGWTPFQVGLSLSAVGLSIAIVQGGLTRIIIPKIGNERALEIGIWISIAEFAVFGWITAGWMVYPVLLIGAISGIAMPALQSLMTETTPANEQGELQGTLTAVMSLTSIIGPLLFTSLFSYYTNAARSVLVPGAPYYLAAVITLVSWIVLKRRQSARQMT